MNSKMTDEFLIQDYRKMEEYIYTLPCGCNELISTETNYGVTNTIHPTLFEILALSKPNNRMNTLDEKRRKRVLHNLELLKSWISMICNFNETKRYEIVKELYKIARALRQLSIDVNKKIFVYFIFVVKFGFLKGTAIITRRIFMDDL